MADFTAYHDVSGTSHQPHVAQLYTRGYRPRLFSVSGDPLDPCYATVWVRRPRPARQTVHCTSATRYRTRFTELVNRGYVPILVSATGSSGKEIFAVVFEQGVIDPWFVRYRRLWDPVINPSTVFSEISELNGTCLAECFFRLSLACRFVACCLELSRAVSGEISAAARDVFVRTRDWHQAQVMTATRDTQWSILVPSPRRDRRYDRATRLSPSLLEVVQGLHRETLRLFAGRRLRRVRDSALRHPDCRHRLLGHEALAATQALSLRRGAGTEPTHRSQAVRTSTAKTRRAPMVSMDAPMA